MSSILTASEEKTNGTRLARLLIDGGTHVLREYLHSIHPTGTLQAALNNNLTRLQELRRKRALTGNQWEKLFPPSGDPPDSKTFDITLLHLLLREICNLLEPSTGWHDVPADGDASPEANIVRIKCFRKELCHSISTGIPDDKFEEKWDKIYSAMVDLGFKPLETGRLKTDPIDHDTERRVEEEVNKWKLDIEPRLEKLEQDFQQLAESKISTFQHSILRETPRELTNCIPDEAQDVFGRSEEIKTVMEAILGGQVAVVVITGGPGFGKSTLANKVCHELVANPDHKTAVLFCSLRSKKHVTDVATSMILVCSKTHSQPPENPQQWLLNWSKQQQQRVTFVLDNADDVLESGDRAHFISILCDMRNLSGRQVNFVITSRKAFKDLSLNVREVRLNSLSPEDAKKVLLSHICEHTIKQKLTKGETLVKLCGYLPLALCIVGSLLSDYNEDELIERLKRQPLEVLREEENDDNSVEKAIKTSFDLLSKTEQEALVLMTAFPGSFNSDAAKAAMTPYMNSNIQPISVLRSLKNRSLIQQPALYRYEIHSLIQAYAKKIGQEMDLQLLDQGMKLACTHFMSRLADNADRYWSKDKCKESLLSFNEDRPNFEYFLQNYVRKLKEQDPDSIKTMPELLVKRLSQKCFYLEMCLLPSVYVQLLKALLCVFTSNEHVSKRVELLCLLGHESRKVGNRNEYKKYLEEAIKKHSRNASEFDKEKVSEAIFLNQLNNYARFLSEQRKLEEAKETFGIALKLCEEHLPTDYVQKAVTLLFSGREYSHRNERDYAAQKLNEALNLLRENLGNHIMTALLVKDLADFHLFHGEKRLGSVQDQQISIKLYEGALEMMVNLGMKDHKECIMTLTNLGICYQNQDSMEEAMQLFEKSLEIAERELEDDHRWKIYVKTQMAFWWKKKGNMEKANALKEEAMEMSDRLKLPDYQPPNKFLLQKI